MSEKIRVTAIPDPGEHGLEMHRARAERHEAEAERLLEQQDEATVYLPDVLAAAQVHATLALAARTHQVAAYIATS